MKKVNYKYYTLTATLDGVKNVITGSYCKGDMICEKDAEKDNLKSEGFKNIKIETKTIEHAPDNYTYCLVDAKEFVQDYRNENEFVEDMTDSEIIKEAQEDDLCEKNGDLVIITDSALEKKWNKIKEERAEDNKSEVQKEIDYIYGMVEPKREERIKELDLVIIDKWKFAHTHTPDFNFELSQIQIIEKALKDGLACMFGRWALAIIDPELKEVWKQRKEAWDL